MKNPTYDELLELFVSGVKMTENTDYSSRYSVRKHNRGVRQYRKAASQINALYPECLDDFSSLLTSTNSKVNLCCAVCMIELMDCSREHLLLAYKIIIKHIESTSVPGERMGFEMWLSENMGRLQGIV